RTPAKFAKVMRSSGISLVNLANNHTFDAEERGFLDTLRALSSAGIAHVGGGNDLAEARKPVILTRNGIKIGFLAMRNSITWASPHSRLKAVLGSSPWIHS